MQEVGAPVLEGGVVQRASVHGGESQVDLNLSQNLLFNESFE